MSGPFTQRGEAAIVSKYARAEMALRCGADWWWNCRPVGGVLRRVPRQGGVQLLHALGVTHLAFGSESGDLSALRTVAQTLDSPAFSAALRPHLQQGLPFASARQKALEGLVGQKTAACLTQPNNLLGIEYLRAIQTLAPELEALTSTVGAAITPLASLKALPPPPKFVSGSLQGRSKPPAPRCQARRRVFCVGRLRRR